MKLSFVLLTALLVGAYGESNSGSSAEDSCILTVSHTYDRAITSKVMLKEADCHDDLQGLKSQADQTSPIFTVQVYRAYKDIEEDGRIMFGITVTELDRLSTADYGTKIVKEGDIDGCLNCTTGIYFNLGGTKRECKPMNCIPKLDGVYVNSPLPISGSRFFTKCLYDESGDGSYVTYCMDFTPDKN